MQRRKFSEPRESHELTTPVNKDEKDSQPWGLKVMKPFEYFEPRSVDEAISLLNLFKGEAKILGGGTDLLVQMKYRQISPRYLINICNIPGLNCIEYHAKEGLRIGSTATIADIEDSPVIRDRFPILYRAASELGTQQVRNIATVGGNLCNASPACETGPALIALRACAIIAGYSGKRVVELEDFFIGPGETVLKGEEMLVEIHIPKLSSNTRGVYLKHAFRKKLESAIVGIAVLANFKEKDNPFDDIRIVLGAVAPTPKRAIRAEELAKKKKMDTRLIERVASVASEESNPITDLRAKAEYRREMVRVLVKKALNEIVYR